MSVEVPNRVTPTVESILADPTSSRWLVDTLRAALSRDPCDAADDAEVLALVLHERAVRIMDQAAQGLHFGPRLP